MRVVRLVVLLLVGCGRTLTEPLPLPPCPAFKTDTLRTDSGAPVAIVSVCPIRIR